MPVQAGVVQRRVEPPVEPVDLGARPDEKRDHQVDALACREVQARAPIVVGGVDVRAALEQQPQRLDVALPRQLAQLAARLDGREAEVAAALADQLGHLREALPRRVPQRRAPPAVPHVDVRLVVEQALHHAQRALGRGEVEARPPVVVLRVDVRAALDQQVDPRDAAEARQLAQLGAGARLVPAEHRAHREEEPRHLRMPRAQGVAEGQVAEAVDGVDVGAALAQQLDDGELPLGGGDVHRSAVVVVARVGVHPQRAADAVHQPDARRDVAGAGEVEELGDPRLVLLHHHAAQVGRLGRVVAVDADEAVVAHARDVHLELAGEREEVGARDEEALDGADCRERRRLPHVEEEGGLAQRRAGHREHRLAVELGGQAWLHAVRLARGGGEARVLLRGIGGRSEGDVARGALGEDGALLEEEQVGHDLPRRADRLAVDEGGAGHDGAHGLEQLRVAREEEPAALEQPVVHVAHHLDAQRPRHLLQQRRVVLRVAAQRVLEVLAHEAAQVGAHAAVREVLLHLLEAHAVLLDLPVLPEEDGGDVGDHGGVDQRRQQHDDHRDEHLPHVAFVLLGLPVDDVDVTSRRQAHERPVQRSEVQLAVRRRLVGNNTPWRVLVVAVAGDPLGDRDENARNQVGGECDVDTDLDDLHLGVREDEGARQPVEISGYPEEL
mmetsp:Transcript_18087/g.45338  ORF Transcript_18087/g.45338 Transcript_18087/m.45338 type:complete len:669 (-) Transcript_18087:683-2689(-)